MYKIVSEENKLDRVKGILRKMFRKPIKGGEEKQSDLNELKAPSIRGTLAGAAATGGPKIGGSTGTSTVGAKTGQSTRSQSPNWNPQQKKEISGMMGRYKSKVVGDLEHKFGSGEGKTWQHEPQSLGRHQLDAWRKTAQSGKVVPAHRGETGAWENPDVTPYDRMVHGKSTHSKWVNTNTNPKRFSVFGASQGEKPDSRWPGVTSTDPYGDPTNLKVGRDLARRKGSGQGGRQGEYRGPCDTVAPRSKPATAAPKTPEKEIDPETNRMAHADKFDPEKQRQQQLDRVSDVMRQQKDVKKNVNFSDFKPEIGARLRDRFQPDIMAGKSERETARKYGTPEERAKARKEELHQSRLKRLHWSDPRRKGIK